MITTAALLLAIFCIGLDLYVVAALIPSMARDLGEQVAAMGLLVSAYALPNALLAPVFGPLSDRFGRRLSMLGGMAFFSVTVIGTALAPSLWIIIGLRALNGLGAAVAMPAVFAYAGDLPTQEQRARAMGNLSMGYPLAALLGLPLGAILAGLIHWRATFVAVAALAALATLLIWRLPADRPRAGAATGYREGLRLAVGDPAVRSVLAVSFIWFMGPFGMFTFVGDFFERSFNLATEQVGIVFVVLGLVGVSSARLSGRFAATIGPRRVVLLAIACFGVAVFVIPYTPPYLPLGLAVFGLWVFGTWFGLPAQQTIAAGLNPRARGTIMAFNASAVNLGAVFSPMIAGFWMGQGGFRLLGTWSAGVAAIALLAAYLLLPRSQRDEAGAPVGAPTATVQVMVDAEDCVAPCGPV